MYKKEKKKKICYRRGLRSADNQQATTFINSVTIALFFQALFIGTSFLTPRLQALYNLLLFLSTGLQELRIAMGGLDRKLCGAGDRCQSLKDDSLSELVAAAS